MRYFPTKDELIVAFLERADADLWSVWAGIAQRLDVTRPDRLAAQLAVLVNGAFVSSELLASDNATEVLLACSRALVASAHSDASPAD